MTAILVCLFVTFLIIPVAAVSIDLSNAYSNRRQMQNAADAASQGGAQDLSLAHLHLLSTAVGQSAGNKLDQDVAALAKANGADITSDKYSCSLVTVIYASGTASVDPTSVTPCAQGSGDLSAFNAVRATTFNTVSTFFAGALPSGGKMSTAASASATAAIQKVAPPSYMGASPFAVCANAYLHHNGLAATPPALLVPDVLWPTPVGSALPYYYKLNVAAEGSNYNIWSNGGGSSDVSDCGFQSQNFNGLICGLYVDSSHSCQQPIQLPTDPPVGADLSITNGAVVGPTLATFAGFPACDPATLTAANGSTVDFTPCGMAVPICDSGTNPQGQTPALLHCITFGLFYLAPGTQHASPDMSCDQTPGVSQHTICGKFIGPAIDVLGGTPSADPPLASDPVRIALVQ